MSAGAVFKLIANDGKADRMIMATALLNQRIKDVMCARSRAGKEDPTPTLVDLEKTHVVFVNAHFKPYAAIGFEYNKVRPSSGTNTLGGTVQFSIPQFGDFFNDMVVRTRLSACNGVAGALPTAGSTLFPATLSITAANAAAVVINNSYIDNNVAFDGTIANTTSVTTQMDLIISNYLAASGSVFDQGSYAIARTAAWSYGATNATSLAASINGGTTAFIVPLVLYVFENTMNTSNPTYTALINSPSQSVYNSIATASVAGIFAGFMDWVLVNAATYTITGGEGNASLGILNDGLNSGNAAYIGIFIPYVNLPTYSLVDLFGNPIEISGGVLTGSYRNFVRYCEYPGNRLFASVKFDVNGNPLDQYDQNVAMMLEKFTVPTDKRIGYNRLVGQETELTGTGGLIAAIVTDANAANTPSGITKFTTNQSNSTVGLYAPGPEYLVNNIISGSLIDAGVNSVALNAVSPQYDVSRQVKQYVNGPQTPKPIQPPLELWNKLKFWFCDDVRLSIPSVSIPFGQRFITIQLASQNALTYEFPSLYLQTVTEQPVYTIGGVSQVIGMQRVKQYTPVVNNFGTTAVSIDAMEMYINNIFVNPEIHDIYIKRIGFSLIRVYRQQLSPVTDSNSSSILLSQLKWPIEFMFVGVQPNWNTTNPVTSSGSVSGNQNAWRDWHRMTRQVDANAEIMSYAEMPQTEANFNTANNGQTSAPVVAASHFLAQAFTDMNTASIANVPITGSQTAPANLVGSAIGQIVQDQYWLPVPTVDTLALVAHGITIYDAFQDKFYSQYMPYVYGGAAIVTPNDPGALFVNMALYPRAYQPSGHLNISRARETYLNWTTSYVSPTSPAQLIAVAVAINFLLISDGSAVLRYST